MKNSALSETKIAMSKMPKVGRMSESALVNLADKDLLSLCQKYGTQTILWKRKFIGLLPEVDRRELYLEKRCSSVYEFAAKFGGVTNEQVKRAISVDKKLEEARLVELREKLINGEVSLNKLARIVSVANEENEAELVKAVTGLSKSAVETLVRDEKNRQMTELLDIVNSCEDTFVPGHKQDYEIKAMVGQVDRGCNGVEGENFVGTEGDNAMIASGQMSGSACLMDLQELGLDARVVERLKELKAQGRDINKVLNEMLDKSEEEMAKEIEKVSEEVVKEEEMKRENDEEIGRYVPTNVKKVIAVRSGNKCEVKGCGKPA